MTEPANLPPSATLPLAKTSTSACGYPLRALARMKRAPSFDVRSHGGIWLEMASAGTSRCGLRSTEGAGLMIIMAKNWMWWCRMPSGSADDVRQARLDFDVRWQSFTLPGDHNAKLFHQHHGKTSSARIISATACCVGGQREASCKHGIPRNLIRLPRSDTLTRIATLSFRHRGAARQRCWRTPMERQKRRENGSTYLLEGDERRNACAWRCLGGQPAPVCTPFFVPCLSLPGLALPVSTSCHGKSRMPR